MCIQYPAQRESVSLNFAKIAGQLPQHRVDDGSLTRGGVGNDVGQRRRVLVKQLQDHAHLHKIWRAFCAALCQWSVTFVTKRMDSVASNPAKLHRAPQHQ